MKISIRDYLAQNSISGDIILYRDDRHKKFGLCQHLAKNIKTDKKIAVATGGAFGLYTAKAFPDNVVYIHGHNITSEYMQQIAKLTNAVYMSDCRRFQDFIKQDDVLFINQFGDAIFVDYYKAHFADILAEVGSVDAFCDCGHSCATLTGAIESGAKIDFVLAVNNIDGERTNLNHLKKYENKVQKVSAKFYDSAKIQKDIEAAYPSFGNIYEATRSVAGAMKWLVANPNKTVLVYVGDSPVYGEDVEI